MPVKGGRAKERSYKYSSYARQHFANAENGSRQQTLHFPSFPFISLTSFRYFVYTLECVATLLREVGAFDLSRERRFRYSIICSHFMADQFTIKLKLHASLRFNQFVCPSHLAADYHFIASQYKCMEFVSVCR